MAIILDADVIIGGEKGKFDLARWVASRPKDYFELAAITVAELWCGVELASGAHKAKRRRYLQSILTALPVIPYTEQTAYLHSRIWSELASSGNMIGAHDLIVAATALERGSSVATFNQRHFSRIGGLDIIVPGMS